MRYHLNMFDCEYWTGQSGLLIHENDCPYHPTSRIPNERDLGYLLPTQQRVEDVLAARRGFSFLKGYRVHYCPFCCSGAATPSFKIGEVK